MTNTTLQERKEQLFECLQKAAELELSTLPPYIVAATSIKPGSNREAREIIHSVLMEEMLHLLLVGNVMSALGRPPCLNEKTVPRYPVRLEFRGKQFKGREFNVPLAPFSRETIQTFMKIEQPEDGAAPRKERAGVSTWREEMDIDGLTIGDFYDEILCRLKCLDHQFGKDAVFSGDVTHQITKQFYWHGGGIPEPVENFETAKAAIDTIVNQGEGASARIGDGDQANFGQTFHPAHFYRFEQIIKCQFYSPRDKLKANVDPEISGATFAVDYEAVWPIKKNPVSADYDQDPELAMLNRAFNHEYSLLLLQIGEAMRGHPRILYTAINNGMHRLDGLAKDMMSRPIRGDERFHGAPTFEWTLPEVGIG